MLADGKSYLGEFCGTGSKPSKDGKTQVPYAVWIGTLDDGVAGEYQISVWRLESKQPFDANKPLRASISRRGNNIFVVPI